MKTFAQHGFGPKDKLTGAVRAGVIDGVILSPRYLTPERMLEHINALNELDARVLLDPEFFAAEYMSHPDPNLGSLEEWDYFRRPRRRDLISGAAIPSVLGAALQVQNNMGLKDWIAPNVYIREADSIDTAVALNFITQAKTVASGVGDTPVYATLAVHRDAVLAGDDFRDILDALTAVETPPDGYYVIVGSSEMQSSGNQIRSDLYHPQVIAGWMYINYALSINGVRVLNGYAHLLSIVLGICGAEASASGWFSGLRKFCIDRYRRQPAGGRSAAVRYVSSPLLSHIKQSDYLNYRAVVPAIVNGLPQDSSFEDAEPSRTAESLQSWEGLSALADEFCSGDVKGDLARFSDHVDQAEQLWAELREAGFSNEIEPNLERIAALKEGVRLFTEWAELA